MTAKTTLGMTSDILAGMYTNYQSLFWSTFNSRRNQSIARKVCTYVKSNTETEHYPWVHLLGDMVEWLDARQIQSMKAEDLAVKHYKYEKTVKVLREELDDDKTGQIALRIRQLGAIAAAYEDKLFADFLNKHIAGSATARWPVGFDGDMLFSTSHSWTGATYSTNQDNLMGSATGNEGKMDATYGSANWRKVVQRLATFKDPSGYEVGSAPTAFIGAPDTIPHIRQILNSELIVYAGTASAATEKGNINPEYNPNVQVYTLPGLTTGYWVACDLSQEIKPFILQERDPIEFADLTDGADAFHKETFYYGVRWRGNFAPGPWWLAICGDNT